LAAHVANAEANEKVEMGVSRGLFSDDIKEQVMEVSQLAGAAGHKRPLYHVHLDWPADVEMTPAMRDDFWGRFEAEFGLEQQEFASQIHVKSGREHEHRQYSLLRDDGHLVPMKSDFARREKLCRSFEFDHNMELVKGKHNKAVASALRADGRPDVADALDAQGLTAGPPGQSNLSPRQRQQMERTGIDPRQVGIAALAAFKASDSPAAFRAALQEQGLRLAQGDRGAVLVDSSGSTHSLTRSIGTASKAEDGVRIRAAEVRTRLEGLDLPTVEAVRADINAADQPQGQQANQPDEGRPIGLGGGGPDLGRDLQAVAMDIDIHSENAAVQAMSTWSQGMEQQVKASAEMDQKAAAATKKKMQTAKEIADAYRNHQRTSDPVPPVSRTGQETGRNMHDADGSQQRNATGTDAASGPASDAGRQRRSPSGHSRWRGNPASRTDRNHRASGSSGSRFARALAAERAINHQLTSPRFDASFARVQAAKARLDAAIKKPAHPVHKSPDMICKQVADRVADARRGQKPLTPASNKLAAEMAKSSDPAKAVYATMQAGFDKNQAFKALVEISDRETAEQIWRDLQERLRMAQEAQQKRLEEQQNTRIQTPGPKR
jgi:hypothetical protein